ncbi:MAG: hypothetical protein IJ272_03485, partial [Clostridia bacterium]|nr:hypothetical protein [Clostridia bacterium]
VLKYKRKTFLFVFLAIALVLATWYKLKIQGITLTEDISYEEVLICENAEETHVHSAECYEKVAVISSDNQNEINNTTTEKQTLNTTETNLSENSQNQEETNLEETNSQEISEENKTADSQETLKNNQQANEQQTLEEKQEEIPEDTEQIKIAEDAENNEVMLAEQVTTFALGDTSTDSSKVNVYLYIDGEWQSIGYVDRGSTKWGNSTYYNVSPTNIINLISSELGITVTTSDFTLYYSNNSQFTKTTIGNNGTYNLGSSNVQRNVYITASMSNNNRTETQLTSGNTFKVYSIKEYNQENELQSTQYVYTASGTATYQLSSDYNYYVNDSENATLGGTTIDITGPTILKQTPAEKCTIIIKYANGTQSTVQVNKGGKYTLDSHMKWKVGNATELTDGGTQITVDEDITIEEVNEITINYTVDISTSATGLNSKYLYDGTSVPTVKGSSTYQVTLTYAEGTVIEKLSGEYITPYDSSETAQDRIMLKFKNWKVNNTSITVEAEQELTWDELYNYAQNGEVNLSTTWNSQLTKYYHANFYINYTSVAVDIQGGVQTDRETSNYTPSLWVSYVGNSEKNTTPISDTSSDNSYTVNKTIRALEGYKEDGSRYILDIPEDEYIIEKLKAYADKLSIDGQKLDAEDLNSENYEIRWYVFKLENECWHVDGKLVRKEGKMTITKTFNGSKAAIEKVSGYSFDNNTTSSTSTYCINVNGGSTENNLYTYENAEVYESEDTVTYTWIVDTKYGIEYTITEKNYTTDGYLTNTIYNIVDPESTKYKKIYNVDGTYYYETDSNGNFVTTYNNQSKASTTGYIATVIGLNNYAIDSKEELDTTKVIAVNFTNTYAPTSAITIQKEDSVTNNGLSNAQFSLYLMDSNEEYDKNSPLKFTYNESIYTYNENGDRTVLTSPTGGSIIIDGLPSGQKYKLVEISVPEGYDGNSSVEVTLDATGEGVIVPVITKGTGKDYDTTNKILEVDNASKLTSVKITKKWKDVPENYIKDVIVELYLNNMPISSYNLDYDLNGDGKVDENDTVQMRVTLNEANNWTYTWNNLPLYIDGAKAIYTAREVQIGDIKAVTDGRYDSITGTWESYDAYTQYRAHTTQQQETKDSATGETKQIYFDLINEIHLVKIEINKISPLGKAIDGVEFTLQKLDESGNIDSTFEARTLLTSEEGKLSFVDLEYDTRYMLIETKGNKGYYLDSTPIYVMIKKAEEQGVEDTLILYKDNTFAVEAVEGDYEYVSLNETSTALNVINIPHTEMPKAGGIGVYGYYILGILLMTSSIIIIYFKNKIKKGR